MTATTVEDLTDRSKYPGRERCRCACGSVYIHNFKFAVRERQTYRRCLTCGRHLRPWSDWKRHDRPAVQEVLF